MAKELKIGLSVLLSILAILAIVSAISSFAHRNFAINAVTNNAAEIETSARQITSYALPTGYAPAMAMTMDGVKVASFHDKANTGAILLLQLPQAATEADSEQAIGRAMARQELNGTVKWSPSQPKTMTIAGKPTTVRVADGADDQGNAIKSVRGVFTGQSGKVAVFIMGKASTWTDESLNTFLGSLK